MPPLIDCPACHSPHWRATGEVVQSRRNLPRARLVCEDCGEAFTSGMPAALAKAAESADAAEPVPLTVQFVGKPMAVKGFVSGNFSSTAALVVDWKQKQAGSE